MFCLGNGTRIVNYDELPYCEPLHVNDVITYKNREYRIAEVEIDTRSTDEIPDTIYRTLTKPDMFEDEDIYVKILVKHKKYSVCVTDGTEEEISQETRNKFMKLLLE